MRNFVFVLLILIFVSSVHAQKIMGFTSAAAEKQLTWEKQYDEQLNVKDLDNWMQFITSHPHHVGSPHDKASYELPVTKSPVPFLNFSSIENALMQLKNSAEEFQKLWANAVLLPVDKQKMLNAILYKAERNSLNDKGLPRRAWYRHQMYAPGFYSGYGVKTLPGLREGIEQRGCIKAQQHVEIVATTI